MLVDPTECLRVVQGGKDERDWLVGCTVAAARASRRKFGVWRFTSLLAAPMKVAAVVASAADASALNGAEVSSGFSSMIRACAGIAGGSVADLNQDGRRRRSLAQVVDFTSMHQKMLLDAPSASPAFDVYSWEFSWLGEMVGANALRPLDDLVQRDAALLNIDDIPKANWEATVWNGKRYGIPVQPHAELTWWRTDLLQAAGLQPPKTTDDLLAAAKALNKPDDGVYGFIWKGDGARRSARR